MRVRGSQLVVHGSSLFFDATPRAAAGAAAALDRSTPAGSHASAGTLEVAALARKWAIVDERYPPRIGTFSVKRPARLAPADGRRAARAEARLCAAHYARGSAAGRGVRTTSASHRVAAVSSTACAPARRAPPPPPPPRRRAACGSMVPAPRAPLAAVVPPAPSSRAARARASVAAARRAEAGVRFTSSDAPPPESEAEASVELEPAKAAPADTPPALREGEIDI